MRRPTRTAGLLFAAQRTLLLASLVLPMALACVQVRLVSSYDEALERGLVDYYQGMERFLAEMERTAGTAAGRFEPNRAFYDERSAVLATLILRAEASEPRAACEGSEPIRAMTRAIGSLQLDGTPGVLSAGEGSSGGSALAPGSCTVTTLRLIRENHGLVRSVHQRNDQLAPAVVAIVRPTIQQGVRVALTAELAKKRGR